MSDYEELVEQEKHLRVEVGDHETAYQLCKQALAIGGPQDTHLRQMMGVNARLVANHFLESGQPDLPQAAGWLEQSDEALSEAFRQGEDEALGNILRDRAATKQSQARVEKLKGNSGRTLQLLADADGMLERSLMLLATQKDWVAVGATVGFRGRLNLASGEAGVGMRLLRLANAILSDQDNRHIDMHNKLHLAAAYGITHRPLLAIHTAAKALAMCYRPDPLNGLRRAGNNANARRAIMLMAAAFRPAALRRRYQI